MFAAGGKNRGSKRSRFSKKEQSSDDEVIEPSLSQEEVLATQKPTYDLSSLSKAELNELKKIQKEAFAERVKAANKPIDDAALLKKLDGDVLKFHQQAFEETLK